MNILSPNFWGRTSCALRKKRAVYFWSESGHFSLSRGHAEGIHTQVLQSGLEHTLLSLRSSCSLAIGARSSWHPLGGLLPSVCPEIGVNVLDAPRVSVSVTLTEVREEGRSLPPGRCKSILYVSGAGFQASLKKGQPGKKRIPNENNWSQNSDGKSRGTGQECV